MAGQVEKGARIDFAVWGSVIPNLGYSNIARETWLDAKLDPTVPATSNVMACVTSITAAMEAAAIVGRANADLALVGGSESMTHVQVGLTQPLSDWLRRVRQARDWKRRASVTRELRMRDVRLHVPAIRNRVTGKSMGEHCEEMAKTWDIGRQEQDQVTLQSHQRAVAAQEAGFFTDLVIPVGGATRDAFPRRDTSLDALARLEPVFDRTNGKGTITAASSSPLSDGAAGVWVASEAGLARLPPSVPRARLVDFQFGAVDIARDGLLMSPAFDIPRVLARNGLTYDDVGLYEIHEAFAAQLLCHLKALDSPAFVRERAGVDVKLGTVPRDRINPNGGSVALGHPFAATGARILSQTVKELAGARQGTRAIVSVCADGGVGCVALLEAT